MFNLEKETNQSSLQPLLDALLDNTNLFPAHYLPSFSDISEQDLSAVCEVWPHVSVERKISLLNDLESIMEENSLLSFDAIAEFALTDEDAHVRSCAISLLWESNNPHLVETLCTMLENDPSDLVQISAAAGLARFVLLGELGEISERWSRRAIEALRKKQVETPHKELKQEILKSLAYTASPEINRQIEDANAQPDLTWQLAAITAMGRTADARWEQPLLKAINSTEITLQYEAVKAVGEIELQSARKPLLKMLQARVNEFELRLHVIWALAHIGGENVKETLQALLEKAHDDEEADVIERALDLLEFSEKLPDLDL